MEHIIDYENKPDVSKNIMKKSQDKYIGQGFDHFVENYLSILPTEIIHIIKSYYTAEEI